MWVRVRMWVRTMLGMLGVRSVWVMVLWVQWMNHLLQRVGSIWSGRSGQRGALRSRWRIYTRHGRRTRHGGNAWRLWSALNHWHCTLWLALNTEAAQQRHAEAQQGSTTAFLLFV